MAVRVVAALHDEILKAKESLKGVDENIKKLTGRGPGEIRPGIQRRLSGFAQGQDIRGGRERIFNAARRGLGGEDGLPPAKRRAVGGAFGRLGPRVGPRMRGQDSGDEDDLPHKPAIPSSVIAPQQDLRTRKDSMEETAKDEKGKARNRRMFGHLLGTLQKFKEESKVKVEQEEHRKAIEEKLEQKAIQERLEIKLERQTLFNERRAKQAKLRHLQQKMELVEIHEIWEEINKPLFNFIRTKTKPHIFYLPKSHCPESENKHKESIKDLEGVMMERRQILETEVEAIMKLEEESQARHRQDDKENEDQIDVEEMEEGDVKEEPMEVSHGNPDADADQVEAAVKLGDEKEEESRERRRRSSEKSSPGKDRQQRQHKEHKHGRRSEEGERRGRRESGRDRRESGREGSRERKAEREGAERESSRDREHGERGRRRKSSGGSRERRESERESRRERRHSEKEKSRNKDRRDSQTEAEHKTQEDKPSREAGKSEGGERQKEEPMDSQEGGKDGHTANSRTETSSKDNVDTQERRSPDSDN